MKINVTHLEALTAAIETAEGKATARTVSPEDIAHEITGIENRLAGLLPKKDWQGLRFSLDVNAQTFPASYRYTPESTHVLIERGSNGWFVTEICRERTSGPTQRVMPVNMAEYADKIAAHVSKGPNWS